jgi:hypothetical protein
MKPTTNVWIAIRNIGDAQDLGDSHNAALNESILWLAQKLASMSMAGRIVIGIGRTQQDALRGIDVKSAGKNAINEDMKALLDSVFEGSLEADTAAGSGSQILGTDAERVAGDDYVA